MCYNHRNNKIRHAYDLAMIFQLKSTIIPPQEGVYIVGGSLRDLIQGRLPKDYDIAVSENPEKFAQKLADKTNGHLIIIGKPGQIIFRVVSGEKVFDVSAIKGMSIKEDLDKRDFTINAMAYDLSSGNIIDHLGGVHDLSAKRVRMVSPTVFQEDPVRLIRAYRISALLNFKIDPETVSVIKNEAKQVQQTAGERVREELFNMLRTPRSHKYISQMAEAGLLCAIFPEFETLKGVFQNKHHSYDVFEHTMKAYFHFEKLLCNTNELIPGIQDQILRYIDDSKALLLKWAILFHDLGKPMAQSVGENGKIHFFDHAGLSAEKAKRIAERLRFSTRDIKGIDNIIRNHMQPLFLFRAAENGTLTKKGMVRFFAKCGDDSPGIILHAIADMRAKMKIGNRDTQAFTGFVKKMIREFLFSFEPLTSRSPMITGDDLIHEFGLTPSPLFKTILSQVEEARLLEQIKTKPEAFKRVRAILRKKVSNRNL